MNNDWDDESDDFDDPTDAEDSFACPECGEPVYADAEACGCGYWITEVDRSAAWRADSATGRLRAIGLTLLAAAALGWLLLTLQ